MGYSPWGHEELKTTERLSMHAMGTSERKEKENRGERLLFIESITKKNFRTDQKKQSSNSTKLTEFQLKVLKKMGIILMDKNIID